MPVQPAVGRVPHTNIRAGGRVIGVQRVDGQRVVLDVQEAVAAGGAAAGYPGSIGAVVPPHPACVGARAAGEADVDRLAIRVGPVDGNVGDDTGQSKWAGGGVVEAGDGPSAGAAVGTEDAAGGRRQKQAGASGEV